MAPLNSAADGTAPKTPQSESVILDLGPMYATDRRQTAASLNAPAY